MLTFQDELFERIELAPAQYHRLIIILNSTGQRSGAISDAMAEKLGIARLNLGLLISQKLLELTDRQRSLRLPQLVDQVITEQGDKPVFLDHIEILFSRELKQDPLRLLQGISRNKTLLVMWNGQVTAGSLIYASPEHPEYRKYPVQDLNILPFSDN